MKVQVLVRLKSGVLDVQGKAVENGLVGLGVDDVTNVRIGRLVELEIAAPTFEEAKGRAKELCEMLLANTIIEDYEIRQGDRR